MHHWLSLRLVTGTSPAWCVAAHASSEGYGDVARGGKAMQAYMDTDIADSCADSYINYALQSVHCVRCMRWVWYSTCAAAFFEHV